MPPDPRARVAGMLAEAAGQARVRDAVHPYWSPLRTALGEAFHPGWEVLDGEPATSALAGSALARMFPAYVEMGQQWARTGKVTAHGREVGDRTSDAGQVRERLASASAHGRAEGELAGGDGANPFEQALVVLVEVEQGEDGAFREPRVRTSSGHAALDRAALAAVRQAAAKLAVGPPPGRQRTSVWAFVAMLGVVPPVPAVSCPPDVIWQGRFERCAWPLKRLESSRVELRALE